MNIDENQQFLLLNTSKSNDDEDIFALQSLVIKVETNEEEEIPMMTPVIDWNTSLISQVKVLSFAGQFIVIVFIDLS